MSKLRDLQLANTARESDIQGKYKEIHTNMIVYLRSSNINEYHQELIREDITNMILEGQERGESPEAIFGKDYQGFMDSVIEAAPQMSYGEKALHDFHIALMILGIMGLIYFGRDLIAYLTKVQPTAAVILTVVDLFLVIIIGGIAISIVNWITRTAFIQDKPHTKAQRWKHVLTSIGIFALFAIMIIINNKYLKDFSLEIPFIPYALGLTAVIGLWFYIRNVIDRKYFVEL